MKSSLSYQVLLHLGSYYFALFCLIEVCLVFYKYIVLPYPGANLAIDLVLLGLLAIIETIRIFFGWKANLTENLAEMALSVALFILSVLGVLYFLIWQTYILRLEMVLCGVQLTIQGLQLIFSVICLVSFYGGNF